MGIATRVNGATPPDVPLSDIDLGNLRYTAGFGLRYRTAFGPIRVDWAFKLNRRDDESRSRVHLTIGHAF